MSRNKIIIFLPGQYDALCVFAKQMAEGFARLGYQVLTVGDREEGMALKICAFAGYGDTIALFVNHAGMVLQTEDGRIIWNELDVDCYEYIVDHPMYYHQQITYPIKRLTIVCVDEYHQKFIGRFYPGMRSAFLPQAGIRSAGKEIPFEKRSMDVLFVGGYTGWDIEKYTQGLGEGLKGIWLECYELLCSRVDMTLEQGVEYCLRDKGLTLPEDDLRDTVRLFSRMDGLLRNHVRAKVIKTLADAGVKVHVYGGDAFRSIGCKQENLIMHGKIPFKEMAALISDARIFLNVLPWYKAGAHERIYSAMLNGAVSLTDSNEYLERTLSNGSNVLFYSLDNLEELPDKVNYYLCHTEETKEIAYQGYLYAKDAQTWQRRAGQMAEIMGRGAN